jgi:hypothetical protein
MVLAGDKRQVAGLAVDPPRRIQGLSEGDMKRQVGAFLPEDPVLAQ